MFVRYNTYFISMRDTQLSIKTSAFTTGVEEKQFVQILSMD